MSNNVIKFPDKKKDEEIEQEIKDNETTAVINDLIDIHEATGCVVLIFDYKSDNKIEIETYVGGKKVVVNQLVDFVKSALSVFNNNDNKKEVTN